MHSSSYKKEITAVQHTSCEALCVLRTPYACSSLNHSQHISYYWSRSCMPTLHPCSVILDLDTTHSASNHLDAECAEIA